MEKYTIAVGVILLCAASISCGSEDFEEVDDYAADTEDESGSGVVNVSGGGNNQGEYKTDGVPNPEEVCVACPLPANAVDSLIRPPERTDWIDPRSLPAR